MPTFSPAGRDWRIVDKAALAGRNPRFYRLPRVSLDVAQKPAPRGLTHAAARADIRLAALPFRFRAQEDSMPSFRFAIAAATLALSTTAVASPPTHLGFSVDATFRSSFYSRACGFPVYERQAGDVRITLFRDANGAILRELDTSPGFKTFWFSPLDSGGTGGAFSSPDSSSAKTGYPDGVYLGAPAFVVYEGLQARAPGQPEAGRDAYVAEVAFIDVAGVPFIDILAPVDAHGNFSDGRTFAAAVCAGLAAP